MSTRQDYITAINGMVGGDLPLDEEEKILAIGAAMKEHSKQRPLTIVEDIAGDGGFDYAVADLASWSDGFSVIKTVEYPVDDDDETPDILQDDAWRIYEKPAGKYLRFLENEPSATETFRATYTALHACTDAACTVQDFDEEAVQALASAHFCNMLSAYYAQTQDSTISADSVDHSSKGREYAARAKMYRGIYFNHIGTKEGQAVAASVTRDQDKDASWAGNKLTHGRKNR